MLLALVWACAAESPASPGAPPAQPTPRIPTPTPPTTPGTATLTLSKPDIVFNAKAGAVAIDTASVTVTAASGESLDELRAVTRYGDGQPDGWLAVDVDGTTLPAQITLRASTAPLSPGIYTATVHLTAPGAAAESLTVTTRVVTGASIGIDAAKICFSSTELGGAGPRQNEYVTVTSVDGSLIDGLTATIVYDAGQPTGWLNAPLNSTTAPARLRLLPSVGSLPVGTYTATVNVASPKAGNSPVPVRVTLTIKEFDPAQQSLLQVHIKWEGPQNGGLATIWGTNGIHCQGAGACTGYLPGGTGDISMWADADYGARFLRWEGPCDGSCTVHFSTPGTTQDVTAVYGTKPSYVFNVRLQGAGASGAVTFSAPVAVPGTGGPLTCRLVNGVPQGLCDGVVEAGVGTFTITATPDPGSVFVWWVIGGFPGLREQPVRCAETLPSCTFTFTTGGGSIDGVVTFASTSSLPLEVVIEGSGYVRWQLGDGYTQDCPTICKEYFVSGSTVTLTAYPGEGATFLGWTDCTAPSSTTCAMVVTENRRVVARFGP